MPEKEDRDNVLPLQTLEGFFPEALWGEMAKRRDPNAFFEGEAVQCGCSGFYMKQVKPELFFCPLCGTVVRRVQEEGRPSLRIIGRPLLVVSLEIFEEIKGIQGFVPSEEI